MFATEIEPMDVAEFTALLPSVQWKVAPGRDYQTAFISPPPGYFQAFFLKIPPGMALHRHVDAGDRQTEHVVLQTNPRALNWFAGANGDEFQHLRQGGRYLVNRTVEHWATNDGEADRIHLILERK